MSVAGDSGYQPKKKQVKKPINVSQKSKAIETIKKEEKGFSRSSVKKCEETCSINGH